MGYCHSENYNFIIESRNGGSIRKTFLVNENGVNVIYEEILLPQNENVAEQQYMYTAIYVSYGNESNNELVVQLIDAETFETAQQRHKPE